MLRILDVLILLLCLVLSAMPAEAAPKSQYRFQHIDSLDGLNQNTIYSLLESNSGMLWIGTQDGLHLYNGTDFSLFLHERDNPNSLSDSFIRSLLQQGDTLWIGTFTTGLDKLDLTSGKFEHIELPVGVTQLNVQDLALLDDQLWLATNRGLYVYEPSQRKLHSVAISKLSSPKLEQLIALDSEHLLIRTAEHGLYLYQDGEARPFQLPHNGQSATVIKRAPDNALWVAIGANLWRYSTLDAAPRLIYQLADSRKAISDLAFDNAGGVWLGGNNTGLVHLLGQTPVSQSEVIRYSPYTADGISDNDVLRLLYDKQGNLWVGSRHAGLNRINVDRQYFRHIFNDSEPDGLLRNNNVRAVIRASNGDIYVGTNDAGAYRIDPQGQFHSINGVIASVLPPSESPASLRVWDIEEDSQQRLWWATSKGLARLSLPDQLDFIELPFERAQIRSLYISPNDIAWLAVGSSLYRYDIASGDCREVPLPIVPGETASQLHQLILNLRHTQSGLWVMTMEGTYLIAEDGEIRYFSAKQLGHPIVRDVLEQANGKIWFATHGGLAVLANGELRNITAEYGLPINTIYALQADIKGNLWFSSNAGISRLNIVSNQVVTFNENEGIQSPEFNGGVTWQDADGTIWFGGIRGLNSFNPNDIPNQRIDDEVALSSYRIGDRVVDFYRFNDLISIDLPYSTELLSFKVSPIDFSYPGHHQYSFMLQGLDSNWHPYEKMNEINYTALPAGQYQLLVRHRLDGSVDYSQQRLASILIRAPFYRTTEAFGFYAFLILLLIVQLTRSVSHKWQKERRIQQQISDSNERFKLALWGSGYRLWDWHLLTDKLTITQLNQDDELLDTIERKVYLSMIHPEDRAQVQQALTDYLADKTPYYEAEYRVISPDGEWEWAVERGKISARDKFNVPIRMAGTYTNINVRKLQEDELKLSYQVLESLNEAVVICDLDYRVISVNPAFSRITGYTDVEIEGRYCLALTRGLYRAIDYRKIENELIRDSHWAGEILLRHADQTTILVWLEVNQVLNGQGEASHLVMVFSDISDRKKAEEDLRLLANYDTLTGLPNRALFHDRLWHALEKAKRNETKVALLFLDLDRFKNINDSKGHQVGDELLKAVAKRLSGVIRASDTVARIGGDEFTIILEGIVKAKAATVIAEKIINVLDQPFELQQTTLDITTSIGISLSPDDAIDAQELLKYADTAMYYAKSLGRNNFQFYTAHLNVSAVRQLQLETGLKQAVSKDELYLVYQPKYQVSSGEIIGFEALLRWQSEELGLVSPSEFIPVAEETGLITAVGSWILQRVCQQLAEWREAGQRLVPIAINLSARQLQLAIIDEIEQTLAQYQLPAQLLEIELTESAVMKHPRQSIAILNRLAELGLSLAVDDFGTGYSSLAYLKRFPINTLKIDREFVRDISTDPDDAAITSAIIALAHSLELLVVAEGVEYEEQLHYLASQDCDQVQGFLLSKPLAATDCLALLRAQ
ncbi:EAL domain-containing protein [Shewanella avicenniae]|uniref:EAL domain-containing protein n=1 Tax=Shewanella avicenniae TaxID=2814294 RepID=A0ABX7QPM6_9GAMM|nr:EAL domain-containing protein [Shewanella avicenniae]QSX33354.1 EAL domain-containing protein [Shewanella avicenniae]